MAKKYTRKQLTSLDQLDQEQERIRHRSKKIEGSFAEVLHPQQLAITFLGSFLSRKILDRKKDKNYITAIRPKGKVALVSPSKGQLAQIRKHPLFGRLLKTAGISFLKWQAFNLALFAGKKIYRAIKEKQNRKQLQRPSDNRR